MHPSIPVVNNEAVCLLPKSCGPSYYMLRELGRSFYHRQTFNKIAIGKATKEDKMTDVGSFSELLPRIDNKVHAGDGMTKRQCDLERCLRGLDHRNLCTVGRGGNDNTWFGRWSLTQ